jgi:prepilin-type N-terminal cleavage/methylation domain-containing protein
LPRKRPAGNRLALSPGVTLIEMMIAVTLVSAIIAGLLMTMRTGLTAYQKVNQRLEANRRVMGLDQALHRQLSGIMPVAINCPAPLPVFNGSPAWVRFVSSSSLAEGARGYARVVEYAAIPDPNGGMRLMMNERLYTGPASLVFICPVQGFLPVQVTPASVEMAGRLAYCRFAYRKPIPDSPLGAEWLPVWQAPDLPRAVRVEMLPLENDSSHLPMLTLNAPVHVTRTVLAPYADQQ